tara:strand:- start:933 stop:1175 length:243 start_codon:yes stop_codon:yes gene_type:complete
MNILAGLMGGLVDKEQMTFNTIQSTLENVAEELGCSYKDFFIMIKPLDENFVMKFYIYKIENGVPKPIREITLKEILSDE